MLRVLAYAAVGLALTLPATAQAHHGWGSYDAARTVKVTAPLTNVEWRNPHGTAKVAYQGKTWDVILAPTTRMQTRGLSLAMIDKGQPVTIEGYPRSDGTAEMRIERITAAGKTVELR